MRADSALYRGTVWIDRKTFARVRVQAVQSGLSGAGRLERGNAALHAVAVVGNRPVFLFSGLTARQILLIAGRNLLRRERRSQFTDFRVNDPTSSSASARRRAKAIA